jgi:hypothetical protein
MMPSWAGLGDYLGVFAVVLGMLAAVALYDWILNRKKKK